MPVNRVQTADAHRTEAGPDAAERNEGRLRWSGVLGVAVSLALLWWALHDISFSEAWHRLRGVRVLPFIGMVLLGTARYPLITVQWRYILRKDGVPLPFTPLWHATAIGFMANNLLPARAGDFARPYVARRLCGVRFSSALASIAVEHITNGIVLMAFVAVGMLAGGFAVGGALGGVTLSGIAWGVGLAVGLALVLTLIMVHWPGSVHWVAGVVATRQLRARGARRVAALLDGLLDGLAALRSPRRSAAVMFWGFAVWLLSAGSAWLALLAFDIAVPWSAVFLLQGIIGLGGAIPSAPGFVGAFEAATKFALALYAVDATQAVSCAVGWHVSVFLPITLLGIWSWSRTHLRVADFRSAEADGTAARREGAV